MQTADAGQRSVLPSTCAYCPAFTACCGRWTSMQPYRLEMGLRFANRGGRNLYEFWGDSITRELNRELKRQSSKPGSKVLVNLASNEYFHAIQAGALAADIITPVFSDPKGGKLQDHQFLRQKARGQMARFIIDRQPMTPPA